MGIFLVLDILPKLKPADVVKEFVTQKYSCATLISGFVLIKKGVLLNA